MSPFDLMTAILKGGNIDPSNVSGDSSADSIAMMVADNREVFMILTTSMAVLIGCLVVLVWRRSYAQRSKKVVEAPKVVTAKVEPEPEVDDGKTKVTIFYGTQTGTAEGFAKV